MVFVDPGIVITLGDKPAFCFCDDAMDDLRAQFVIAEGNDIAHPVGWTAPDQYQVAPVKERLHAGSVDENKRGLPSQVYRAKVHPQRCNAGEQHQVLQFE